MAPIVQLREGSSHTWTKSGQHDPAEPDKARRNGVQASRWIIEDRTLDFYREVRVDWDNEHARGPYRAA